MSSKDLDALKQKITTQEMTLRQEQAKFQQDLFTAQNGQMAQFMKRLRGIVQTIAAKKKLEMVLPKNSVLYSDGSLNITQDVLKALS